MPTARAHVPTDDTARDHFGIFWTRLHNIRIQPSAALREVILYRRITTDSFIPRRSRLYQFPPRKLANPLGTGSISCPSRACASRVLYTYTHTHTLRGEGYT